MAKSKAKVKAKKPRCRRCGGTKHVVEHFLNCYPTVEETKTGYRKVKLCNDCWLARQKTGQEDKLVRRRWSKYVATINKLYRTFARGEGDYAP